MFDLEPQLPADFFLGRALALQLFDLIAVPQQLEVLPGREQKARATRKPATPTDFQSSRCRVSSISRTIGLLRTSFLIAYSNGFSHGQASSFPPRASFALRARGLRCTSFSSGMSGFFVSTLISASLRSRRAQRVLHDPILERMKRDDREPRAGAQPRDGGLEEAIEAVELAVDPDPERLKRPRRGIDAHVAARVESTRRTIDGERACRVDRRLAARLDQRAGDAPREPLFAVAEDRVGELDVRSPAR